MLKTIRYMAWAAIAALVIAAGAVGFGWRPAGFGDGASFPLSASVGGPFELAAHDGRRVSDKTLAGKPFVMFFGFTYCPDVCPTSLLDLTNLIKDLGPDADKLNYVFVTVDPERDTAEALKLYMSNFDARIIGLSGTLAETAAIAKAYRVFYQKVTTKADYTINHTSTTYLMDGRGRFVGTIAYQEAQKTALIKLRNLIAR